MSTIPATPESGGEDSPRTSFAGRVAGLIRRAFNSPEIPRPDPTRDPDGFDPATNTFAIGDSDWRRLVAGDLVTVYEDDGNVAQVLKVGHDGHDLLLAPLFDLRDKHSWLPERRWHARFDQVRLITPPPLPLPVDAADDTPPRAWKRAFTLEAEELYKLLKDHVPPLHAVRSTIARIEEESYEWQTENPLKVERAVLSFYSELPPEEQRRVLNGWTPHPIRPAGGEFSPDCDGMPVRLAVEIAPHFSRCWAEWRVNESTAVTDVTVWANTTKREVMADIRAKLAWIDAHWSEICAAVPDRIEGGAS